MDCVWCHLLPGCLVPCSFQRRYGVTSVLLFGPMFLRQGVLHQEKVSIQMGVNMQRGVSIQRGMVLPPIRYWHLVATTKAGDTHHTGMHTCYKCKQKAVGECRYFYHHQVIPYIFFRCVWTMHFFTLVTQIITHFVNNSHEHKRLTPQSVSTEHCRLSDKKGGFTKINDYTL